MPNVTGMAFTDIGSVVSVAHCPAFGVNVYDPDDWLLTGPFHVPVIGGTLFETVGNTGTDPPEQIGELGVNNGTTEGETVAQDCSKQS